MQIKCSFCRKINNLKWENIKSNKFHLDNEDITLTKIVGRN